MVHKLSKPASSAPRANRDSLPVAVYNPAWTIITWNAAWAALMGEPSTASARDRNLVWRTFTGKPTRVPKSEERVDGFEIDAVADLRRAVGAYPDDPELRRLIDDLPADQPPIRRTVGEAHPQHHRLQP